MTHPRYRTPTWRIVRAWTLPARDSYQCQIRLPGCMRLRQQRRPHRQTRRRRPRIQDPGQHAGRLRPLQHRQAEQRARGTGPHVCATGANGDVRFAPPMSGAVGKSSTWVVLVRRPVPRHGSPLSRADLRRSARPRECSLLAGWGWRSRCVCAGEGGDRVDAEVHAIFEEMVRAGMAWSACVTGARWKCGTSRKRDCRRTWRELW